MATKTKTNNANRTVRITVRFYAPDCCAPRTIVQEVREIAPMACLFVGTLIGSACAFAAIAMAIG
jgi:hypothetical protein